jgi:MinD-like ATPase involved in chromosome partitioning or flagellar assembly
MIFTFFSYKGGVGRSMALANIAVWLYQQGLRIVMIDWDLEAPGLESFFCSEQGTLEEVRATPGLIDTLWSYRREYDELTRSTPGIKDEQLLTMATGKLPAISALLRQIAPRDQELVRREQDYGC